MSRMRRVLGAAVAWAIPCRTALGAVGSDRRGNVAIMAAMLVVPVGLTALALDVGNWEVNKSSMQGAADQAALAASVIVSVTEEGAKKEAREVAAKHGFVDGQDGVTVAPHIPPTTGAYAGKAKAIEVVITQDQTRFLGGMLSAISAPTAMVRAVVAPNTGSMCIMALATSGTGLDVSTSSRINATDCNVYVNSLTDCAANLTTSSQLIAYDIVLGSKAACTSTGSSVRASNSVQVNVLPAAKDPYASRRIPQPVSKCKDIGSALPNPPPGTYCSLRVSSSQVVNLKDGLYVIDGGGIEATTSSRINATNVTLVATSSGASYGGIKLSSSAALNITPMTSGPTAGIAIWLDPIGKSGIEVTTSAVLNATGAIYAPASNAVWSSSSNSPCMQLIAYSIKMTSSANLTSRHECAGLGVEDVAGNGYKLRE